MGAMKFVGHFPPNQAVEVKNVPTPMDYHVKLVSELKNGFPYVAVDKFF